MKGRVIERLAREYVLPVLPNFVAQGSLVYRRPVGEFLAALSFDTSGFTSSRIYVTAFVQPLFVPADHVWLNFGDRLGGDFWDVDEDDPAPAFAGIAAAARRDALPLFDELDGLDRFCETVPRLARSEPKKLKSLQSLDDPVVAEALGYAELLRGRQDEGIRLVESAVASEREDDEYADDERIENLERVLDAVRRLGLEAGQTLLAEWRAKTIRNLRIED